MWPKSTMVRVEDSLSTYSYTDRPIDVAIPDVTNESKSASTAHDGELHQVPSTEHDQIPTMVATQVVNDANLPDNGSHASTHEGTPLGGGLLSPPEMTGTGSAQTSPLLAALPPANSTIHAGNGTDSNVSSFRSNSLGLASNRPAEPESRIQQA